MTVLWTTEELPGHDWDPDPDAEDDDSGPWCRGETRDLRRHGLTHAQLNATETVPTTGEYL